MNAEQLFTAALALVESASIKEWAQTDHNRPIFVKIAEGALAKNGPSASPSMFSALIVSSAIGL